MSTTKILNVLARSLRNGREVLQRKSLASQCECRSEAGTTNENQISANLPHGRDGHVVFTVLASGIYPYINNFK